MCLCRTVKYDTFYLYSGRVGIASVGGSLFRAGHTLIGSIQHAAEGTEEDADEELWWAILCRHS